MLNDVKRGSLSHRVCSWWWGLIVNLKSNWETSVSSELANSKHSLSQWLQRPTAPWTHMDSPHRPSLKLPRLKGMKSNAFLFSWLSSVEQSCHTSMIIHGSAVNPLMLLEKAEHGWGKVWALQLMIWIDWPLLAASGVPLQVVIQCCSRPCWYSWRGKPIDLTVGSHLSGCVWNVYQHRLAIKPKRKLWGRLH